MTAIAIKAGEVAADSQLSGSNSACRVMKLVRLPDGSVAAGAGAMRDIYRAFVWLKSGAEGEGPEIDDATVAIVKPDHTILLADGGWPAYPIMDTTYAIGCASDLVRQALADGLSPAEAVAKACRLDTNSSAPIYTMTAQEPPKAPEFEGPKLHKARK